MDENVFKVVVSFHPDGRYTVCASENETVEPTEKNSSRYYVVGMNSVLNFLRILEFLNPDLSDTCPRTT